MAPRSNSVAVREFFDHQQSANRYASLKAMTGELDVAAGEQLNDSVHGDVLAIGGVWDHFQRRSTVTSLTVLDLSIEMLNDYCPAGSERVHGDLYTVEFPPERFDSVVFPLVLHHTPRGRWRDCENRVREALARAHRWLKPDGVIYLVEYCPHPAWSPLQRALLPVTRRFLAVFRQPLVVMYTRRFYERVLAERFDAVWVHRVDPPGFDYGTWYPVFMAVRWLKMPLAIYPKMHVFSARRGARGRALTPVRD